MKYFIIIFITVISIAAFAQTREIIDNAPSNYLNGLKSDNLGVVESAIFHSVKFKLYYPDEKMDKLISELNKLIGEGETGTIRHKAYIALQFLNNPGLLSKIEKRDYKDPVQFFLMLGDSLNDYIFATK
ncbi:MAG: hypothetical protein ACE5GL_07980 [Calditrichia bacterium]